MDVALILSASGLILTLLIIMLVQLFKVSDQVSKSCGQWEAYCKANDKRVEAIEERLEKANL